MISQGSIYLIARDFDSEHPDKVTTKGKVYKEYDDYVSIAEMQNTGKVVI